MRVRRLMYRSFLALLIGVLVGVGVLFYLISRTPEGYNPDGMSDQQLVEASNRAVQKSLRLQNLAARSHAAGTSAEHATTHGKPLPLPPNVTPITISFTQDELNAAYKEWSKLGKSKQYESMISKPFVKLEANRVVLMGTLAEYKKIVSIPLSPQIDQDGMVHLNIGNMRLGDLPLPDALLSKYRKEINQQLRTKMPGWQLHAKVDAGGQCNADAVSAAMGKLVLAALDHRSSPALMFIGDGSKSVAVRLHDIQVIPGELSITVYPLEAKERSTLQSAIKEPLN